MSNCTICHSAEERAKKSNCTADYYRNLFTEHSACTLAKRAESTNDLMRWHREQAAKLTADRRIKETP